MKQESGKAGHTPTLSGCWRPSLPGFTIMELLVTLVVSGIVIAAALQLYLNYEGLIRGKNKQMESGKEIMQFYQVFKHEFDNSLWMKSSGNEVFFALPEKRSTHYELDREFIVRFEEHQADTFFIRVNDLNITSDALLGLGNGITMELNRDGEVIPVSLLKQYSNDLKMNKQCQSN